MTKAFKFLGKVVSVCPPTPGQGSFHTGLAGIWRSRASRMNGHPASILEQGRNGCKV